MYRIAMLSVLCLSVSFSPVSAIQTEDQTFKASTAPNEEKFGWSASVDGDRGVVGAPDDELSGVGQPGYVFCYEWDDQLGIWIQSQAISHSELVHGDQFGWAVSMDGDRLLIGARTRMNSGGHNTGAVYFYEWSGTQWLYKQRLEDSAATTADDFGFSVSLDGDVAVIGAPTKANSLGQGTGVVYVFRYNNTTQMWEEEDRVEPSVESREFGYSVSASGEVFVVGAPKESNSGPETGSAHFYRHDGNGNWNHEDEVVHTSPEGGDRFGHSVSLDGPRAVVGAPEKNDAVYYKIGFAYEFDYNSASGNWDQIGGGINHSPGGEDDRFGWSVSLQGDDLVVGAYTRRNSASNQAGIAFFYQRDATTWTQEVVLRESDEQHDDMFGRAVALSGNQVFIGAPFKVADDNHRGLAYAFTLSEIDVQAPAPPTNVRLLPGRRIGWNPAPEPDFDHHTVYGSQTDQFESARFVANHSGSTMNLGPRFCRHYWVTTSDDSGNESAPTKSIGIRKPRPRRFPNIIDIAPSPFNPVTTIRYSVAEPSLVSMSVVDVGGRIVDRLIDGEYVPAGDHAFSYATSLPSGVYFVRLQIGTQLDSRRIVILK